MASRRQPLSTGTAAGVGCSVVEEGEVVAEFGEQLGSAVTVGGGAVEVEVGAL